jgi:hypothetical protein
MNIPDIRALRSLAVARRSRKKSRKTAVFDVICTKDPLNIQQ